MFEDINPIVFIGVTSTIIGTIATILTLIFLYYSNRLARASSQAERDLADAMAHQRIIYDEQERQREARIERGVKLVDIQQDAKPTFGLGHIVKGLNDFIDRVIDPEVYADILTGNEILIVGASQSGKKSLAYEIAKAAGIRRACVVINPYEDDVLDRVESIIADAQKAWRDAPRDASGKKNAEKILLLLPNLDDIEGNKGETWFEQLGEILDTASETPNILVAGTVQNYDRNSKIAHQFGTILQMPGREMPIRPSATQPASNPAWREHIKDVVQGYLGDKDLKDGTPVYLLKGTSFDDFVDRIMDVVVNEAEIEDIIVHCQVMAIYNRKYNLSDGLFITPDMLKIATERVVPPAISGTEAKASAQMQGRQHLPRAAA